MAVTNVAGPETLNSLLVDATGGRGDLAFYLENLFRGIKLRGRSMLDIGSGKGLMALWAASKGACRVVCLEPEAEGSTQGVRAAFHELRAATGYRQVELHSCTFQEYEPGSERFDIILMNNSINHLAEEACRSLAESSEAVRVYHELFTKLHSILNPGGELVIADCSRHNLFNALGLKNPFSPTINWKIHQSPRVWSRLLSDVGFKVRSARWASPSSLGAGGRLIFGNALVAHLTTSHFSLVAYKKH